MQMFKVDEAVAVRVDAEALRRTVARLFERVGVPPEDAAIGADHLVTADLRGVESHGVSNMLRSYLAGFREGRLNPRPSWRIEAEAPGGLTVNADGGLGIIVAPKVMDLVIEKARTVGVGVGTLHSAGHPGMVSYMAMQALPHAMIGMCNTAGGRVTVPTFGAEPRLGTNPISFAAPAGTEAPFVFDAATTVIARNQIRLARRQGKLLPPGVIADAFGRPIMDEAPAPPDDRFSMLPLGATRDRGSHKGYGLSCIVEILGSQLAGQPAGAVADHPASHVSFQAINVGLFTPIERYRANMDDFLRALRTTPPAPGHERVVYPGLLEAETTLERQAHGIPLHPEVIAWFDAICAELNAPPPTPLAAAADGPRD